MAETMRQLSISELAERLEGLYRDLSAERAGMEAGWREEVDRLHATIGEYRESEIVLRARIEELEGELAECLSRSG